MQGLEKQNDFQTIYYHRSTNKKNNYIAQILRKRSRIELLTYHPNLEQLFQEASLDQLGDSINESDENIDEEVNELMES